MRKDLTEVVFILDRSGSMRGLEAIAYCCAPIMEDFENRG